MTVGLVRSLVKMADPGEDAVRAQALKDILTVGGIAAAGGIGARGLLGMNYMFGRRRPDVKRSLGPTVISVPTPVYKNPRDEERAQLMALKMGAETLPELAWRTITGQRNLADELGTVPPGGSGSGPLQVGGNALAAAAAGGTVPPEGSGILSFRAGGAATSNLIAAANRLTAGGNTGAAAPPGGSKSGPLQVGGDAFAAAAAAAAPAAGGDAGAAAPNPEASLPSPRTPSWMERRTGAGYPALARLGGAAGLATLIGGLGLGAYGIHRALRKKPKAKTGLTTKTAFTDRSQLPWYLPGLTMGGIGGLAGGYKLMDYLLDKKRKSDLAAEVEDARAQYQQSMMDQYDPANVPAAGGLPEIPLPAKTVNPPKGVAKLTLKSAEVQSGLDDLCRQIEKSAADMPGWMGKGLGIYGTLAGLLALGSGTAAYRFTKDRSTNKLMESAIKQRERERWLSRPPEIYAIPTPVRLSRRGDLLPAGAAPVLPGTEER